MWDTWAKPGHANSYTNNGRFGRRDVALVIGLHKDIFTDECMLFCNGKWGWVKIHEMERIG